MAQNLVIVESPAKAKTINKYLGKDFQVLASYGHVRDLVPKEGAVDTAHDFHMKYQLIERNSKHVNDIVKALKPADTLYLATDPDREGEAISWHLYALLEEKNALKDKTVGRVVFHEITKRAVNDAIANPRELSTELVNAQQARRALDYLVGFNLSPLLWKKIRRGLSAGRVQSPALRMICEREDEIDAFKAREYWTIEADVRKDSQPFVAKLTRFADKKVEQFSFTDDHSAQDVKNTLEKAADGTLNVVEVNKKQRKRNPAAPFTTSTLQQEASRKLGFTTRRTMRTAQQLYEGIDTDDGAIGLITYMRTDAVTLANEALSEIRDVITHKYGADQIPEQPRRYKTKAKNAQEAHEAIRPTSASREPTSLHSTLSKDQFRLYELIWKRTVACQMVHAVFDTVAVDFGCGDGNQLRATGSVLVKPGFMAVYQEGRDDTTDKDKDENKWLPELAEGDAVSLDAIRADQHFTEPPPRFTEARLVRTLEEYGIGRPSTYASIIHTLQQREYVEMDRKRFIPTDVGRVVNKFLTDHFTRYVDYEFTAQLENELDEVARGEKDWVPVLDSFWSPFKALVDDKEKSVSRKDVTTEEIDEKCPTCDSPLAVRLGRRGRFIGCTNYPECKYTRNVDESADDAPTEPEKIEGRQCPDCGSDLIIRRGRYGKFIGCSGYPKCKHLEPLEKPKDTGIDCPECHQGHMLQRKSRYGKIFYSCERYPKCKYAVWNLPIEEPCPDCEWPLLTVKTTKRWGTQKVCPQKACGYKTAAPELAPDDGDEAKAS